jgi:hypothetical protein
MAEAKGASGPQFRADRPVEQEAVRTTIVGGRPPGSGQSVGPIPRGIEVLVKKAAVDPEFKELLLQERAAAAEQIGLMLDPAEAMMLAAAPRVQLEAVIAQTSVPEEHRRAFLGKAAAAMLAAIGIVAPATGCGGKGIQPDRPTKGIRPDRPDDEREKTTGSRPDRPEGAEKTDKTEKTLPTKGIRPDRPEGVEPPANSEP